MLGLSAVVFCEYEMLQLRSVVFCAVRTAHKFDFRIVISEHVTHGDQRQGRAVTEIPVCAGYTCSVPTVTVLYPRCADRLHSLE